MLVLTVEKSDTKNFMNKLLKTDTFDTFQVRNIEVLTFTKFQIDGFLNKNFSETENREFATWSEVKYYVLEIIKGKTIPSKIKLVFSIGEEEKEALNPEAKTFFINILFENNKILITNSTTSKNFSLDKSLEIFWDEYVYNFFRNLQVPFSDK